MRTKLIISGLILFLVVSCDTKNGVDFKVTNKTKNRMDSIIVTNGYHFVKIADLEIDESESGFIDFEFNNPRNDGNYSIQIFENNKKREQLFGYYSNGMPLNSNFDIIIRTDTIIVN